MYSSFVSRASIAVRSVLGTRETASSGSPAPASAPRRIPAIATFERIASDPPRRITAFPDLTHRAAASAVTLGRDS